MRGPTRDQNNKRGGDCNNAIDLEIERNISANGNAAKYTTRTLSRGIGKKKKENQTRERIYVRIFREPLLSGIRTSPLYCRNGFQNQFLAPSIRTFFFLFFCFYITSTSFFYFALFPPSILPLLLLPPLLLLLLY